MVDVSIILVSFNTAELTVKCLNSIFSNTSGVTFEIIVVDNASTDESVSIIKKRFSQILLIQCAENLGFGRANNIGAAQATGKYLFLLNTDTVLLNNAVKVLFDFYESFPSPDLGAIGGVLLNPDLSNGWSCNSFNSLGSIIQWYYVRPFLNNRKKLSLVSGLSLSDGEFIEVDYVTGADLFIKKDLFDKVRGFDQNIFLYYEDELLQWQLKEMGKRNVIIGGVRIIHLEGGSLKKINNKVSNRKRIISERSMFYYFKTSKGACYKAFTKSIYFFMIALPLRVFYTFDENKEYLKNYLKF